jgi:cellobiose-specific phosphotransferase system component IIC
VLTAELFLVVAFTVGWELVRSRSSRPAQLGLIAVAAVAMGLQSAVMRSSSGNTLSTTYLRAR